MGDAGIECAVRLRTLVASHNARISTVAPCASTLRVLGADGDCGDADCGIDDRGLASATRLRALRASCNPRISTVSPFGSTLTDLDATGLSGIDDEGLVCAVRLRTLRASYNSSISSVAPFAATLRNLFAAGGLLAINDSLWGTPVCGIDDAALAQVTRLRFLDASGNPTIASVAPFARRLRRLVARDECAIDDAALGLATRLEAVDARGNDKLVATVARLSSRPDAQHHMDDDGPP